MTPRQERLLDHALLILLMAEIAAAMALVVWLIRFALRLP